MSNNSIEKGKKCDGLVCHTRDPTVTFHFQNGIEALKAKNSDNGIT